MKNQIEISEASLYVGTYHKYNCGSIAGKWVKLLDFADASDFYKYCSEIHADESDPEFMFQDYENLPKEFYSECGIDNKFWDFAEALLSENINYGDFCEWANHFGYVLEEDSIAKFQDSFRGNYGSPLDFTWELAEQNGWLEAMDKCGMNRGYFDAEQFQYELFDIGEFSFINGAVYCSL